MKRENRNRLLKSKHERGVFVRRPLRLSNDDDRGEPYRINGRWMGYRHASRLLYASTFRCREWPRNDPRWRMQMAFRERANTADWKYCPF